MSTVQNDEKSIFEAASQLRTRAEQAAYLEKVCAADPALKQRILALLEADEDKGDFLEAVLDAPSVLLDDVDLKEMPGTVIDRYKLLEKIGEGGMAVVYMAEQAEPIRRKVALKIIKLGMDTKSVIARFEAERQALAIMDHPNIAKVYDAGATETGRPYFVMELVNGISITDYCDREKLKTNQRLELLIPVCQAVQHAHQKGIIHRDLKPSNVMVTMHDDKPVPKIIDFGIAKATNQRLTEKTVFTRYAHFIGTPAYMSPEQAQMSGLDVDTRSDIYSLGVLLYELLTGATPFDAETLREAGYTEIQRIICETNPLKPSTKLNTLGQTLTDIAQYRQANPETLRKLLRGDLDWIAIKCLEKDRTRRYETAHALAEDLRRHLKNEPILARPPRLVYRAQKFWRRHKWHVATAAIVAVLLAGLVASAAMYQHASKLQWAKGEALPRIGELVKQKDYMAAFSLAKQVDDYIPEDPALRDLWPQICLECSVTTIPAGADVFVRELPAEEGTWEYLGRSPLLDVRLPRGAYRWLLEKPGYEPRECVVSDTFEVLLQEKGDHPEMVLIGSPTCGKYLMDRFEVTNQQFKRFVDAGGYRNREYWSGLLFVKEGRSLAWEQAMGEFCDRTGQSGPSTWEGGSYPKGQELYPVSGISWYEATAYARFTGKSLPTISHWFQAAQIRDASLVLAYSNFGRNLAPVGSHAGIGRYGLYDMAGNVREWCFNATDDSGTQRYILGGSWADPTYTFREGDLRSPWDRSFLNGMRCSIYSREVEQAPDAILASHPPFSPRDVSRIAPLADGELDDLLAYYAYDRTPLNPVVEPIADSSSVWREEKITVDAAYGDERITVYLFLPKTGRPPYQTVVYFPGGEPIFKRSFERLPYRTETEFILASGRALVLPVYKGTFDRPRTPSGDWSADSFRQRPMMYRDWIIQIAKDLGRSIDYLQTREDIDQDKIGYLGFCWGGTLGLIMIPTEHRIKAAVLVSGGLPPVDVELPRFIEPIVLAQGVRIPVLMLNGKDESRFPLQTSQIPAYQLLGTANEHKLHKLYPGGDEFYGLFLEQAQRDILDWLDCHLGSVNGRKNSMKRTKP